MTINHNTHQSHAQSQPITVNFGVSGAGTPDIFGRTQREAFGHRGGIVSDDSDGGGVVGREGSSALGIGGQTSDDSSQEAMRIFASSPLDPIQHGVGHGPAGETHARYIVELLDCSYLRIIPTSNILSSVTEDAV
jgi:hypothetical protein